MPKILLPVLVLAVGCGQQSPAHPPVGGVLSQKDLSVSRTRAKQLNELERRQIQSWINAQTEKFYPMSLNYWVNIKDLDHNRKKADGETVSYSYELYDFDKEKFYPGPTVQKEVQLGRFDEIDAVEDAIRYLQPGENATLLVPSVLAFGTYGDNFKIGKDMPLIIKIKVY